MAEKTVGSLAQHFVNMIELSGMRREKNSICRAERKAISSVVNQSKR
jgi:hypothetical protein